LCGFESQFECLLPVYACDLLIRSRNCLLPLFQNRPEAGNQPPFLPQQHRIVQIRDGVLERKMAELLFLVPDMLRDFLGAQFPDFFRFHLDYSAV